MERMKVAICMEEGEYLKRFSACLVNNYRNLLEIHMFTNEEDILQINMDGYDVFLAGDFVDLLEKIIPKNKLVVMTEHDAIVAKDGIVSISKYEELPHIVDAIGMLVGKDKVLDASKIAMNDGFKQLAVYSLHKAHLQLPFIILLANILSEQYRVLVVDLQENSGLGKLGEDINNSGMEELLALFSSGKHSRASMIPYIGHYEQWDYIYPVQNSECICEADYLLYKSMISGIVTEIGYDYVLFNLGNRFQGFFQLLEECQQCYFLIDKYNKNWRDQAFEQELQARNIRLEDFEKLELSSQDYVGTNPKRMASQWQWGEIGDVLRSQKIREGIGG